MVSVRLFLLKLGGAFLGWQNKCLTPKIATQKAPPNFDKGVPCKKLQRAHPPQFKHLTASTFDALKLIKLRLV